MTLEEKLFKLRSLTSNFLYVEYYTHEECDCYKIDNVYTNYRKDVRVLGKVSDGFEICLERAISEITKCKEEFEKHEE